MSTSKQPDPDQPSRRSIRPLIGLSLIAVGTILVLDRLGVRIAWRELLSVTLILIGAGVVATARRGVPSWLVSAGVVTGIALLLVSAGGLSLARGFGPTEEHATTLQFDEPVHALDVEIDAGAVEVIGGADGISAERSVRYRGREPRITEEIVDGVLRVRVDCAWDLLRSGCRADYSFRTPSEISVVADSGSGAVRVSNIAGPVQVETGSGHIDIHRVAGEVGAETGSGRISGDQLETSQFVGDTGSGAVDLEFTAPPDLLEISTGSGSVNVRVPEDRYAVDVDTGSGATSISDIVTDPDAPRRIEVETGSGTISIAGAPAPS